MHVRVFAPPIGKMVFNEIEKTIRSWYRERHLSLTSKTFYLATNQIALATWKNCRWYLEDIHQWYHESIVHGIEKTCLSKWITYAHDIENKLSMTVKNKCLRYCIETLVHEVPVFWICLQSVGMPGMLYRYFGTCVYRHRTRLQVFEEVRVRPCCFTGRNEVAGTWPAIEAAISYSMTARSFTRIAAQQNIVHVHHVAKHVQHQMISLKTVEF